MESAQVFSGQVSGIDAGISCLGLDGSEVQIKDSDVISIVTNNEKEISSVIYSRGSSEPDSPHDIKILRTPTSNLPPLFVEKHLILELPPQLSLPPDDLYILISSGSGTGKAEAYFQNTLRPALTAIGVKESGYQVITTKSENSIKELTVQTLMKKAEQGIRQTVILLSGDGGVVDIVNSILGCGSRSRYVRYYSRTSSHSNLDITASIFGRQLLCSLLEPEMPYSTPCIGNHTPSLKYPVPLTPSWRCGLFFMEVYVLFQVSASPSHLPRSFLMKAEPQLPLRQTNYSVPS